MRLIARFPNQTQVSALVDSLRNEGFDRKDMIISDLAAEKEFDSFGAAFENIAFTKTERDEIGKPQLFSEGIKGLEGKAGIIVAVETPKHNSDRVRSFMEQSGAVEIIQD